MSLYAPLKTPGFTIPGLKAVVQEPQCPKKVRSRAITPEIPKGWPVCLTNHNRGEKWLFEDFEQDLCTTIPMVEAYRISKMAYYKQQRGGWGHDFVLVTFDTADNSQQGGRPNLRYLKYERDWKTKKEFKGTREARNRSPSDPIGQDELCKDLITLMPAEDVTETIVRDGETYLMREMTFSDKPTILDLAAVLEAHSVLSPKFRLYATMGYWYAGSTWRLMKDVFDGNKVHL